MQFRKKTQNSGFFLFPFGLPVDFRFIFSPPFIAKRTNRSSVLKVHQDLRTASVGDRFLLELIFSKPDFSASNAPHSHSWFGFFPTWKTWKKTQGWYSKNRIITSKNSKQRLHITFPFHPCFNLGLPTAAIRLQLLHDFAPQRWWWTPRQWQWEDCETNAFLPNCGGSLLLRVGETPNLQKKLPQNHQNHFSS